MAAEYNLMVSPRGGDAASAPLARATASYTSQDDRYQLKDRAYLQDIQYAPIYFARLMHMQPRLMEHVRKAWPGIQRTKILDVVEGQEVAVVGTVYKDMKMKPNILDEYTKDRGIDRLIGRTKFSEADDTVVLEDEGARVLLRGEAIDQWVGPLVTGVSIAVRGTAAPGGDHFQVTDVLFAGLGPQRALPPPGRDEDAKYLALVSGLGVGNEAMDPQRLALVVDYLTGVLGDAREHARVSQVVRCVIAGGLLSSTEALAQPTTHVHPRQQAAVLEPVRDTDLLLTQLAAAMPVDVMPGASDPANHSLPQQPLHHCLFPGACCFTSFNRVTNPHDFVVEDVHILGTSGQNVDDIYKYSAEEDRLQILSHILEWGHLIPTAPDTLSAHPFPSNDPFVMTAAPHILFAGNQREYASKLQTGKDGQQVRLIAIPSFASTGVLLLLNLSSLDVETVNFDTHLTD